jgi:outer membrane immunogenic protein
MKKLLIATAAAVALATAGTAGAADLPVKAPPMAAPVVTYTWTGCYLSGGVGYGMWNQDHDVFVNGTINPVLANAVAAVTGTTQLTPLETSGGRGWLGRVGGGCDYQFNNSFVVGVFGDYDWRDMKSHDGVNIADVFDASEKNRSAWAVGGRIGYLPYPNLLTFVSGGWAEAHYDGMNLLTATVPQLATPFFINSHTYSGWFIGGGYEYRLPWWQNVTWKTEYRFAEYDHDDLPIFATIAGTTVDTGARYHSEKFDQTVTTSLVWRFNWGGPVVARY